jgi:pimeloyl-ACP methyl ester carboxylesterase
VAPGQDVSFREQARMISAFLDALEIDQVDLVGNDTGGGISQIFAATYPQKARSERWDWRRS